MIRGTLAAVFWLAALPLFAADTLVLCPREWQPELHDWAALRRSQGHGLTIADAAKTVGKNQRLIQQANTAGDLRCVVLVGDVAVPGAPPCGYEPLEIIRRWGPDKTVATDHVYADLEGDAAPELAVGRIPCRSAAELSTYLRRVIAYETSPLGDQANKGLSVVASPGNFSPWLDRVLEAVATRVLTEAVPPSVRLSALYASPPSRHFPGTDRLHDAVLSSYQRPALAWVYLGHGLPDRIDQAPSSTGPRPLLDTSAARRSGGGSSPPIACMIACYTGAFDARGGCLGEAMLARPNGPLAVIAASRVTMPYGNSVLGVGLLEALYAEPSTAKRFVGAVVQQAKSSALAAEPASRNEQLLAAIESIAAGVASASERYQERVEHSQAYNLLGDPLLSLKPRRETRTRNAGRALPLSRR